MTEDDRYTRQRRLREVGDAGQERLFQTHAIVRGREAALVELVYLHRAGVGAVELDSLAPPPSFAHEAVFRHDASRRHAAAAWRALRTIVEIIEPGATS